MNSLAKKTLTIATVLIFVFVAVLGTGCQDKQEGSDNTAVVDDIEYTVVDTVIDETLSGNDDEIVSSVGKWVMVKVDYKNTADDNRELSYQNIHLKNGDTTISADSVAGMAVLPQDQCLNYLNLSPDQEGSFNLIFNVTDEVAESDQLELLITSYADPGETATVSVSK